MYGLKIFIIAEWIYTRVYYNKRRRTIFFKIKGTHYEAGFKEETSLEREM
jgi:hypothetical protein